MLQLSSLITSVSPASLFSMRTNRNQLKTTGNPKSLIKLNSSVTSIAQPPSTLMPLPGRDGNALVKRPMLSDLRERGSLEQDADIVLFLCRDDFCRETEEDPIRLMELIVAKHRNGPVGKVELFFSRIILRPQVHKVYWDGESRSVRKDYYEQPDFDLCNFACTTVV